MSLFKSKKEREWQELEKQREKEQQELEEQMQAEAEEKERKELKEKAQSYVFTISASDYAKSRGKDLSDYDLRCVFGEKYRNDDALIEIVREGIAIGAEAIVDVRPSHDTGYYSSSLFLIGTALIPKTQS